MIRDPGFRALGMLFSVLPPPLLRGPRCDLGAFLGTQLGSTCRTALQATETAQGYGVRVPWPLIGQVLLCLAGGFQHDPVGKLVWVSRSLL